MGSRSVLSFRKLALAPLGLLGLMLLLAGCDSGGLPELDVDQAAAWKALGAEEDEAAFDASLEGLAQARVDPKPAVGVHNPPAFPADLPFNPAEWTTNPLPRQVGDPRAKKGGEIKFSLASWPATLRTEGPNSRLTTTANMHVLIYEPLLEFEPTINDFVPALATHWWVSEDKKRLRFRLDPRARWSDGHPVTSDDVKATFEHMRNPDRKDPSVTQLFEELIEEVRILDRLTVEVALKNPRWRSLVNIGGALIYPAHYIRMDGDTYINEWSWRLPPGSGPYVIRPEHVKKGVSITLTRRPDFWAADEPANLGKYNFDKIVWVVVREEELLYQKFLKGELDLYRVSRAQRWVDEVDAENAVQNGWVQKRKIYNNYPEGFSGYCFNMRKPPFDKRNTRAAFAHFFNREKLFAKFFFFQYDYLQSYYPVSVYERPNAERIRYDPEEGRRLLALDGWVRRNAEGFLVDEQGERFPKLSTEYVSPGFQRLHEVFKNALWQEAGIELELKRVDNASLSKRAFEYKFDMLFFAWSSILFPRPEGTWHSKYAKQPQTNNLSGFSDPRADEIMDAYEQEWNAGKRAELLQELDSILFEAHPYALGWGAPYVRYLYWDKFGHPPEYFHKYTRDDINVMAYWWYDEARWKRTSANLSAGKPNYPNRPANQYDDPDRVFWQTHKLPMQDE